MPPLSLALCSTASVMAAGSAIALALFPSDVCAMAGLTPLRLALASVILAVPSALARSVSSIVLVTIALQAVPSAYFLATLTAPTAVISYPTVCRMYAYATMQRYEHLALPLTGQRDLRALAESDPRPRRASGLGWHSAGECRLLIRSAGLVCVVHHVLYPLVGDPILLPADAPLPK